MLLDFLVYIYFSFAHRYESGDGTKAFGKGELKTFSDNSTGEAVEGSFSYKVCSYIFINFVTIITC